MMKRCMVVVAVMMAGMLAACGPEGQKQRGVKMERLQIAQVLVQAEVKPEAALVGDAVEVRAKIWNQGSEKMPFEKTATLYNWDVEVRGDGVEPVEMTAAGKASKNDKGGGGGMMAPSLKAGETEVVSFELTKLFELSQPGKYRVTVRRLFRNKAGVVMSKAVANTVEFTVVRP